MLLFVEKSKSVVDEERCFFYIICREIKQLLLMRAREEEQDLGLSGGPVVQMDKDELTMRER